MEISERDWARVKADLYVCKTLTNVLMTTHPHRDVIIEDLRVALNRIVDTAYNTTYSDIEIEEYARSVKAFFAVQDRPDAPARK